MDETTNCNLWKDRHRPGNTDELNKTKAKTYVNKKLAIYQSSKIYKAAVYDPDALHFLSRNNTSVIVWACIIIYGIGEIVGDAIQQQYVARWQMCTVVVLCRDD